MEKDPASDNYQYSGDQYSTSDYSAAGGSAHGIGQMMNNEKIKRIAIVVGVIAAVFICYKIFESFISDEHKKSTITPLSNQTQPFSEKFKASSSISEAPAVVGKHLGDIAETHSEVSTHLSRLSQQNDATNSQLSQMSLTMSSMNAALSNITGTVSHVNESIQSLNRRLQVLQRIQTSQERELARQKTIRLANEKVRFYVQAMVPGRAWLKGTNGTTLTVSRGDQIPNYGVVERVDDKLGVIVTNTGRILRFGIHAG